MKKITKAIIPAAGYGTRFLPITKAVPKEMLPILDRPSIDFVIEECLASGITDICIVISRGKEAILNYLDVNTELESALIKAEKRDKLAVINKFKDVKFTFVLQPEMRGTAKAIELCKNFVGNDPVAVLFPDDVIHNPEFPVTAQLIKAYETTGATIVGCQNLSPEEAIHYGVMQVREQKGKYVLIDGFQEKPSIDKLSSTITSLGRFILTPEIFDYLGKTKPVKNGEIYLPSFIDLLAKDVPVYAYLFDGIRYDLGSKFGFLKANIEFALRDPALREQLIKFIKGN
ncbi:MAG: UTP--glucose-1-phosphate uridylyltransferase [Clostridia bacterium]|nr:UTP--glucose-1-phosphate uridylyltransferase [Clostridia bacterium]